MADAAGLTRAIGVISGTSMDGIDVSVVDTDGDRIVRPGAGKTFAYPDDLRSDLLALIAAPQRARNDQLQALDDAVTRAHAGAIRDFMREQGFAPSDIALIGLHGQTILHRPEERFTRQLGDGAAVARLVGVDTVSRFRHADVAAGGEGAPFAPLYHRALAHGLSGPLMVLNWGGVGNVTYIDGDEVLAFDTGPGNMVMDAVVTKLSGGQQTYDRGGRWAARGKISSKLLAQCLKHPYLARKLPKTTGREEFGEMFLKRFLVTGRKLKLSDADLIATATAFTAASLAEAYQRFVIPKIKRADLPKLQIILGGGGAKNPTLVQMLQDRLPIGELTTHEHFGIDSSAKEPLAFAILAHATLSGEPSNVPSVTGARRAVVLGKIEPLHVALTVISVLLFSAVALRVAAKAFESEQLRFGGTAGWLSVFGLKR